MASLAVHSSVIGACLALGIVAYLIDTAGSESAEPIVIATDVPQIRISPPPPKVRDIVKDIPIRLPDLPLEIPPPHEQELPEPEKAREPEPPPPEDRVLRFNPIRITPSDKPVSVEKPDKAALRVLEAPRPRYPLLARRRGQTGLVEISYEVFADGSVRNVQVSRSSGVYSLDEACLKAVRQWRYSPPGWSEPVPERQLFEFRIK